MATNRKGCQNGCIHQTPMSACRTLMGAWGHCCLGGSRRRQGWGMHPPALCQSGGPWASARPRRPRWATLTRTTSPRWKAAARRVFIACRTSSPCLRLLCAAMWCVRLSAAHALSDRSLCLHRCMYKSRATLQSVKINETPRHHKVHLSAIMLGDLMAARNSSKFGG